MALRHSLGHTEVDAAKIYVDTSGSMRGFALAATINEAGASEEYQSILVGLDSLRAVLEPPAASAKSLLQANGHGDESGHPSVRSDHASAATDAGHKSTAPAAAVPVSLARFGSTLEPLSDTTSLLSAPLGKVNLPLIGGRAPLPIWRSGDCRTRWGGGAAIRTNLDNFYSEPTTCLNLVFDDIMADRPERMAYVLVTDAEQDAPEDSAACSSAKNLGNIQARLYQWVQKGNFAAVVAFRVRSLPWQAQAVGSRFCDCDARYLFVYLLTPSAELAERLYSHLATFWKGDAASIAYLPFSPRPASEFRIQMTIPKLGAKSAAIVPSRAPGSLTDPETGALPQFWVRLNQDQVELQFTVIEAGFESPETRKGPGFCPIDWKQAQYEWQQPVRFEAATHPAGPPSKDARALEPTEASLGLTFTRPPAMSPGFGSPVTRIAHYAARAVLLGKDHMTPELSETTYIVHKRQGHDHGCELFLVQLNTTSVDLIEQVSRRLPLVKNVHPPCLDLTNIRTQIRFVYRPSPVVRFLLHVDY